MLELETWRLAFEERGTIAQESTARTLQNIEKLLETFLRQQYQPQTKP